jgi:predicted GH43/DUF377 family glycosyl hydrolase
MVSYKSFKIIITIVLLYIFTLPVFPQTEWTRHPENPVLNPGVPGSWDESLSVVNTILFHQNIYKMWYEGDNGFGYATSVDGIIWIKDSLHNPVLEPGPPGSWDEMQINQASVLFKDNIYHLWYSGIDIFNDNRIGYATSPDGINWTKDSSNPVINHGDPGTWDDEEVMHPFVIYENDTLKMYYNGHDGITQRILCATSVNGKNWNKFSSHPILVPGFGGTWDSNELGPMAVVHHDNQYHMWYTGWNYADYIQIGYATSPNGIDWTKDSVVLGHGEPSEWDDAAVAMPFVVVDIEDTLYKMWYGGTDGTIFQTGYATSGLVVSVEKEDEVLLERFVLHQNYPNPFNPSTKIKFTIPSVGTQRAMSVLLKVYDVIGNEIVTLVNEELSAGEYEIEFNSVGTSRDLSLTSGIYFYQLIAGDFIQTKKMILLK